MAVGHHQRMLLESLQRFLDVGLLFKYSAVHSTLCCSNYLSQSNLTLIKTERKGYTVQLIHQKGWEN